MLAAVKDIAMADERKASFKIDLTGIEEAIRAVKELRQSLDEIRGGTEGRTAGAGTPGAGATQLGYSRAAMERPSAAQQAAAPQQQVISGGVTVPTVSGQQSLLPPPAPQTQLPSPVTIPQQGASFSESGQLYTQWPSSNAPSLAQMASVVPNELGWLGVGGIAQAAGRLMSTPLVARQSLMYSNPAWSARPFNLGPTGPARLTAAGGLAIGAGAMAATYSGIGIYRNVTGPAFESRMLAAGGQWYGPEEEALAAVPYEAQRRTAAAGIVGTVVGGTIGFVIGGLPGALWGASIGGGAASAVGGLASERWRAKESRNLARIISLRDAAYQIEMATGTTPGNTFAAGATDIRRQLEGLGRRASIPVARAVAQAYGALPGEHDLGGLGAMATELQRATGPAFPGMWQAMVGNLQDPLLSGYRASFNAGTMAGPTAENLAVLAAGRGDRTSALAWASLSSAQNGGASNKELVDTINHLMQALDANTGIQIRGTSLHALGMARVGLVSARGGTWQEMGPGFASAITGLRARARGAWGSFRAIQADYMQTGGGIDSTEQTTLNFLQATAEEREAAVSGARRQYADVTMSQQMAKIDYGRTLLRYSTGPFSLNNVLGGTAGTEDSPAERLNIGATTFSSAVTKFEAAVNAFSTGGGAGVGGGGIGTSTAGIPGSAGTRGGVGVKHTAVQKAAANLVGRVPDRATSLSYFIPGQDALSRTVFSPEGEDRDKPGEYLAGEMELRARGYSFARGPDRTLEKTMLQGRLQTLRAEAQTLEARLNIEADPEQRASIFSKLAENQYMQKRGVLGEVREAEFGGMMEYRGARVERAMRYGTGADISRELGTTIGRLEYRRGNPKWFGRDAWNESEQLQMQNEIAATRASQIMTPFQTRTMPLMSLRLAELGAGYAQAQALQNPEMMYGMAVQQFARLRENRGAVEFRIAQLMRLPAGQRPERELLALRTQSEGIRAQEVGISVGEPIRREMGRIGLRQTQYGAAQTRLGVALGLEAGPEAIPAGREALARLTTLERQIGESLKKFEGTPGGGFLAAMLRAQAEQTHAQRVQAAEELVTGTVLPLPLRMTQERLGFMSSVAAMSPMFESNRVGLAIQQRGVARQVYQSYQQRMEWARGASDEELNITGTAKEREQARSHTLATLQRQSWAAGQSYYQAHAGILAGLEGNLLSIGVGGRADEALMLQSRLSPGQTFARGLRPGGGHPHYGFLGSREAQGAIGLMTPEEAMFEGMKQFGLEGVNPGGTMGALGGAAAATASGQGAITLNINITGNGVPLGNFTALTGNVHDIQVGDRTGAN